MKIQRPLSARPYGDTRRGRRRPILVAVLVLAATCLTTALGAGLGRAAPHADLAADVTATRATAAGAPRTTSPAIAAQLFATVAGVDPGPFGTSLEGAAFDKQGHFYFVNTTAPAGQPKLMSLNLDNRKVTDLYTDADSMLNCLGFAPDGTMYLCDLKGRKVVRFAPTSKRLVDVLDTVAGSSFVPDDLTIDSSGDMYIADYRGDPTAPTGRILLREANGNASVAVTGLAHPNGIVLAADQQSLWVDEDLSGKLDHVADQLSSPAETTPAVTVHTAAYLSLGANAYADSLTVDGQGNVYLAVYGAGEVLIFNSDGVQVSCVRLPRSARHTTHVAIQPGTRRAFVTASGPASGYIYTFPALAAAPAHQPNGG